MIIFKPYKGYRDLNKGQYILLIIDNDVKVVTF